MNGTTTGAIQQTVSGLVIGEEYELRFSLAGNPYVGGDSVGSADSIKDMGLERSFADYMPGCVVRVKADICMIPMRSTATKWKRCF